MFKNNIFALILIVILLAGNVYFSMQYASVNKQLQQIKNQTALSTSVNTQAYIVLKEYLNVVLNSQASASSDDRVKLENDLRQLKDAGITSGWEAFIGSKDSKTSQANALNLIMLLENKMMNASNI